jgi:predicted acylesterase/phospholipase RssA/CRP-like cAMP-binding protein
VSDVKAALQNSALFANAGDEMLEIALRQSDQKSFEVGELVTRAGDPCDCVLIVLEGRLAVTVRRDWGEERILSEIGQGGLAGEVEVLNGDNSMADIRALEPTRLLYLSKPHFEQLLQVHPDTWNTISEQARRHTCRLLVTRHLNNLFGTGKMKISDPLQRLRAEQEWLNFEQEVLHSMEETVDWVTLRRGQYLFRQGDASDGAYVVVSGALRVSVVDADGKETPIARIAQGEILGELALITDEGRSASISALRDCELFRLPASVFTLVSEKYPQSMLNVYRTVTDRFRTSFAHSVFREKVSNIAILPANEEVDLDAFVQELHEEMKAHHATDLLSSESVDESLGRDGISTSKRKSPANLRLVQWLNGREGKFDQLLLRADQPWSRWSDRCIRQADRVIVVADAFQRPDLAAVQKRLEKFPIPWSLVLVHAPDTVKPSQTSRWLESSTARQAYHVRSGNRRDMARLSRILTGNAIGLVLGGGGARGFAHLGVLRALEELGIPIDMVGGSSIGAPIGGWVATGKSAHECLESARRAFRSLIDITFPTTAMLDGKRISQQILKEAEGWDMEDCWLPFFCVSTNLTTSQVVVHRRGVSARAVRASVSIPGVLPPVPETGELLVDGSVLNNLPIDIMRELNPSGLIIAIDVVLPSSFTVKEDYGLNVSGWRQLLSRIIPWLDYPETPSFAGVIMQSMMVGSSRSRERLLEQGQADYYQNIHVHGVGMLQFDALEMAQQTGYSDSIGPLRKWAEEAGLVPASD